MSPRTTEQFEAIRKRSRAKIMKAALILFAKYGFRATTITQIATKAKVAKGLVYHYFKSKHDLLDELLRSSMTENEEMMAAMLQPGDPLDKISLMLDGIFNLVRENENYWKLLLSIITQPEVMGRSMNVFAEMIQGYFGLLEALFTELKVPNPKLEAYKLGALIDGVMLHYLFYVVDDYPLMEIKNKIIQDYAKYRKKK